MAKWAIGLRLADGGSDDAVEAACDDGRILRLHVLRPTWHFVAAEDLRLVLQVTAKRVHQANAFMYRSLELDPARLDRFAEFVRELLRGGNHLTRNEIRAALPAGWAEEKGFQMAYLMMYAELEGVVVSGPRHGNQYTYALVDERVPPAPERSDGRSPGRVRGAVSAVARPGHDHGPHDVERPHRDAGEEGRHPARRPGDDRRAGRPRIPPRRGLGTAGRHEELPHAGLRRVRHGLQGPQCARAPRPRVLVAAVEPVRRRRRGHLRLVAPHAAPGRRDDRGIDVRPAVGRRAGRRGGAGVCAASSVASSTSGRLRSASERANGGPSPDGTAVPRRAGPSGPRRSGRAVRRRRPEGLDLSPRSTPRGRGGRPQRHALGAGWTTCSV